MKPYAEFEALKNADTQMQNEGLLSGHSPAGGVSTEFIDVHNAMLGGARLDPYWPGFDLRMQLCSRSGIKNPPIIQLERE